MAIRGGGRQRSAEVCAECNPSPISHSFSSSSSPHRSSSDDLVPRNAAEKATRTASDSRNLAALDDDDEVEVEDLDLASLTSDDFWCCELAEVPAAPAAAAADDKGEPSSEMDRLFIVETQETTRVFHALSQNWMESSCLLKGTCKFTLCNLRTTNRAVNDVMSFS